MPVWNEENHLAHCLDSIIVQSYTDWELHAVDDFSTDRSLEILTEYAKSDKRIHVHRNLEKGIISALELGYSRTSFPYVTRMDADDKMHPQKLEKLFKVAVAKPHSCVTALVEYFSDGSLAEGFLRYANWLNELTNKENHYNEIYKECVVASPCWMMHRETIEKVGGITAGRYPEDYDLIFRLYEHHVEIQGISEVLHYWRDHAGRASRNDPNYADQGFIELKMHYLAKLEFPKFDSVTLWGAGRAGKLWAKALIEKGVHFTWVTNNKKKIGKEIYGVWLSSTDKVESNCTLIVAIKSKSFYAENQDLLAALGERCHLLRLY